MKRKTDVLLPAAALSLSLVLAAGPAASREPESVGVSSQELSIGKPKPVTPRPNSRWSSYNFSAPNPGLLVYTIMPDGNPACASYNGRACLWGVSYAQIDFRRVKPLVCGQAHRALYQVTGYEDPKHWCSVARRLRARK